MDNQQKFNFEVTSESGQVNFRTGTLNPPVKKINLDVEGVINGPANFFISKKYDPSDFTSMLVTYNLHKGEIIFNDNVVDDSGRAKIVGKLTEFRDLDRLSINQDYKYTTQKLSDVLKMSGSLFRDRSECMELVNSLRNFSVEIGHVISESNDTKGNKLSSFAQNVSAKFKLSFILKCNIFSGVEDKKEFKVEILCDVRDKALELWLESVELKEIIDSEKEKTIISELVHFKSKVPIIQIG